MEHFRFGEWSFEIKQIKARKVSKFGENFTAVVDINIADGLPHLEAWLNIDGNVKHSDYKSISKLLVHLGFSKFSFRRAKDSEFKVKVKNL